MDQDSEFLFVGIDAHQETLSVAVLPEGASEPEPVVTLPNRPASVRKWFRRLLARGSAAAVYEAGCLGFVLHRLLDDLGVQCVVAAPSHLPKIPGDHRKTDRIDARRLDHLDSGDGPTPPPRHIHINARAIQLKP